MLRPPPFGQHEQAPRCSWPSIAKGGTVTAPGLLYASQALRRPGYGGVGPLQRAYPGGKVQSRRARPVPHHTAPPAVEGSWAGPPQAAAQVPPAARAGAAQACATTVSVCGQEGGVHRPARGLHAVRGYRSRWITQGGARFALAPAAHAPRNRALRSGPCSGHGERPLMGLACSLGGVVQRQRKAARGTHPAAARSGAARLRPGRRARAPQRRAHTTGAGWASTGARFASTSRISVRPACAVVGPRA